MSWILTLYKVYINYKVINKEYYLLLMIIHLLSYCHCQKIGLSDCGS